MRWGQEEEGFRLPAAVRPERTVASCVHREGSTRTVITGDCDNGPVSPPSLMACRITGEILTQPWIPCNFCVQTACFYTNTYSLRSQDRVKSCSDSEWANLGLEPSSKTGQD